jgi:hypothetical protein
MYPQSMMQMQMGQPTVIQTSGPFPTTPHFVTGRNGDYPGGATYAETERKFLGEYIYLSIHACYDGVLLQNIKKFLTYFFHDKMNALGGKALMHMPVGQYLGLKDDIEKQMDEGEAEAARLRRERGKLRDRIKRFFWGGKG